MLKIGPCIPKYLCAVLTIPQCMLDKSLNEGFKLLV